MKSSEIEATMMWCFLNFLALLLLLVSFYFCDVLGTKDVDVLVLGAGLSGIGAAMELHRQGTSKRSSRPS